MSRGQKKYVEQDVWELACERMAHVIDNYDTVSVMFSGGKDSTVCLNVALEAARAKGKLPLQVVFFDEEAIPLQTVDYVQRVKDTQPVDMRWLALPNQMRNACSRRHPYWWSFDPDCPELWVREPPSHAVMELEGFPMQPPATASRTTTRMACCSAPRT